MHLSPPPPRWLRLLSVLKRWFCCCDFLFIVTPIVGFCNCSVFCCTLLYVHSSIAIILMGKRELIALLNLSPWCLVMVERLFLAVPRVVCSLWLWYFLIILTYYFWVRFSKSAHFVLRPVWKRALLADHLIKHSWDGRLIVTELISIHQNKCSKYVKHSHSRTLSCQEQLL